MIIGGAWFPLLWLIVLPVFLFVAWAALDALVRPETEWAAADQSKVAWLLGLLLPSIGLGFLGGVLSFLVALTYVLVVRPRLLRAAV